MSNKDSLFLQPAPFAKTRLVLCGVALVCAALIGAALYLQYGMDMQPCPLCVIQRIVFISVGILCLIGASLPAAVIRFFSALAGLVALCGAAVAGWHLWVLAHPGQSCGIDPLETAINKLALAHWMPFLFEANGLCSSPYPPIFGLGIPQWTLVWYVLIAIVLIRMALQRAPVSRLRQSRL